MIRNKARLKAELRTKAPSSLRFAGALHNQMNLEGKTAIVTGGTRGIGRAIAESLLREGLSVCIAARNHDEIEKALVTFAAAFGSVSV